MAMKRGERVEERFPEPDLLPIMNIIFMLILALVSMAALLPLGVLSSEAQKISKGGIPVPKEGEKALNLVVFITEKGFNISVHGEVKMGGIDPNDPNRKLPLIPNIPMPDGNLGFDYIGLHNKLVEFKKLAPEELSMTVTADPEVITDVIIQTMDASRFITGNEQLFPKVSFAAGLVG
jgi:hypothetical protein